MAIATNSSTVTGINLADSNPTSAENVNYVVTFNQNVTGVDSTDFSLLVEDLIGASIIGVTGTNNTYTVSVNTGTGDGTLGLSLIDDDSIKNSALVPLGGTGVGNGNFAGKTYTVDKTSPSVILSPAIPDPLNSSVSSIAITFSEPVSGLTIEDLNLTQNGVPISLTGATLATSDNQNWILGNLTELTNSEGSYQLTLDATNSQITDLAGNSLTVNASDTWDADFTSPNAAVSLSNISEAGVNRYTFAVTYSDNIALDINSIAGQNILVTGPNNFSQIATLVSVTPAENGTPRTATYSFIPPDGTWDLADDGTYTVQLQSNQVSDTAGNFGVAGSLGTFKVNIAPTPTSATTSAVTQTTTPTVAAIATPTQTTTTSTTPQTITPTVAAIATTTPTVTTSTTPQTTTPTVAAIATTTPTVTTSTTPQTTTPTVAAIATTTPTTTQTATPSTSQQTIPTSVATPESTTSTAISLSTTDEDTPATISTTTSSTPVESDVESFWAIDSISLPLEITTSDATPSVTTTPTQPQVTGRQIDRPPGLGPLTTLTPDRQGHDPLTHPQNQGNSCQNNILESATSSPRPMPQRVKPSGSNCLSTTPSQDEYDPLTCPHDRGNSCQNPTLEPANFSSKYISKSARSTGMSGNSSISNTESEIGHFIIGSQKTGGLCPQGNRPLSNPTSSASNPSTCSRIVGSLSSLDLFPDVLGTGISFDRLIGAETRSQC